MCSMADRPAHLEASDSAKQRAQYPKERKAANDAGSKTDEDADLEECKSGYLQNFSLAGDPNLLGSQDEAC